MIKQALGILFVLFFALSWLGCDLPPEFSNTVKEGIIGGDLDTEGDGFIACADQGGQCVENDDLCDAIEGEVEPDLVCSDEQVCCVTNNPVYKLQWTCLICEKN